MRNFTETIELLKKYNQEHIINLLNKLEENKKENLINQINHIDLDMVMKLYENTKNKVVTGENIIEHIKYLEKESLDKQEREVLDKLGEEILKNGEYAVVTMAGGQGTRLEHLGPKGTFKLNVFGEEKSLFEILADNLKEANKKYNIVIPWYIMTSKENNDETLEFLETNDFFGYDKSEVMLFSQGELPLVDTEGKMLVR